MSLPESAELFLDSARGQYIPRDFFDVVKHSCLNWHCNDESKAWILDQCSSPDNEFYWDAWNDCENGMITVTDPFLNIEYGLYQDGDLWLVPLDAEWHQDDY